MYTLLYKNMFKTIRKTNSMRLGKCSKDTLMWSAFKHILTLLDFELHISHLSIWICGMKIDIFSEWRLCASLAPTRQCWAISAKFRRRCFFGFLLPVGFCLKSMSHPNLHTRNLIQIWSVCKSAIWKSHKHFLNASSINDKAHIFRLRCWYVMAYASPSRHIIPKKKWCMDYVPLHTHTHYITSQRIKHQTIKPYRHVDILLIQETPDPGPECVACRLKFRSSFHLSFILGQCTVKPGAVLG